LTTEDTAVISSPGDNITINDHTATAEEVVAALEDQGINKIIAITHLGWDKDIALAHKVEGIDIIVGGHSDTVPDPYPTVIKGDEPVIVVQAGGRGEYLGRFDLVFDADGVIQSYSGELLEVEMFDKDPEYAAKLAEYHEAIEGLMETVVGETLVDLDGERAHVRTRETNLGNLITDAMLAKASCVNATIAIQNGGGIRASIPTGNITLGTLMELQPFGNYLVVFNLRGEQIIAALENGVSKVEEVSGRFPQVAGLRYTWDQSKNQEARIISVEVKTADGDQQIDPLASYRIVTNNFLFSGGDGYTMFQNGTDLVLLGFVDYEVLREYIEEHSPVAPEVEGRIFEGRHHFIELTKEWQEMGLDLNDLEPEFVATTPDGRGALVTIQEGNAVAVVNSSKWIKIITLPNEAEPDGIAISPDGEIAVTANEEGQSISIIDLSQGLAKAELVNTIDVLQFLPMDDPDFKHDEGEVDPEGVVIFNKEGRSYAVLALEKSASLLVLDVTDPNDVTKVSLLPVGISGDEQNPDDRVAEPEGVAISPRGDLIAVGNEEEGTVSLIPIFSGGVPSFGERMNFEPSGKEAEIIAFTSDQKNLLVTNSKENTLIILNISDLTEIKEKQVLDLSGYGEPTSVAVSPNGEYALVSIADGVNPTVNPGKVVAISLLPPGQNEIFTELSVGQVPDSLGITPDGNYAFIANEAENEEDIPEDDKLVGSISVIDLASLEPVMGVVSNLHPWHPRRGHQLTLANGKLWITGGKAYYSHFLHWGEEGYEEFTTYPNLEYIDSNGGEVVYTDIETKTKGGKAKDFYKATAFTLSDEDTSIYIAGKKELLKLDTLAGAVTEIVDPGKKADWRESSWGRISIGGKDYVVLICEDGACFFDPEEEKFVEIAGVGAELPEMVTEEAEKGFGGCVIDNKFYLFGGERADESGSDKAWVFDPNVPSEYQWSSIADMPVGINCPKVECLGECAYIIGGITTGYMYDVNLKYDPSSDSYVRTTILPYPTYKHDTAVVDDDIWISYGYSWGTDEERRYGFRMHPPHVVRYSPLNDSVEGEVVEGGKSVIGKKLNLVITWPDPDKITGSQQTIAINWLASTSSTNGTVYYREKGETNWNSIDADATDYCQVFEEAQAYTAALTCLEPEKEYDYYVVAEGPSKAQSEIYTYKAQPEEVEEFKFIAYGDSKAQYDILHEINCDILQELEASEGESTFVVQLGDFGAYASLKEWEAWFNYGFGGKECTKEMAASYAFLPVHGNHEYLAPSWFNSFEMPKSSMEGWPALNNTGYEERWYSFNYGSVHMAVITTGEYSGEEWYQTQLDWLEADLARAKQEKESGNIAWIIILLHHSAFTSGDHFEDLADYGLFDPGSYVDVIDSNGAVDVVLASHDHDYERSKMIKGFRCREEDEELAFYRLDSAFIEESSERFGTATKSNGTIWVTTGGAGAGQRDMQELENLGDASWIAFRKPDPEKGESAETHPCFHYVVVSVTRDTLKMEAYEKEISYLPEWTDADDDFEGLLDSVVISKED
jgi:DNA-binding beta-propeller fold protein YncE